jgi:hypothetical protein
MISCSSRPSADDNSAGVVKRSIFETSTPTSSTVHSLDDDICIFLDAKGANALAPDAKNPSRLITSLVMVRSLRPTVVKVKKRSPVAGFLNELSTPWTRCSQTRNICIQSRATPSPACRLRHDMRMEGSASSKLGRLCFCRILLTLLQLNRSRQPHKADRLHTGTRSAVMSCIDEVRMVLSDRFSRRTKTYAWGCRSWPPHY